MSTGSRNQVENKLFNPVIKIPVDFVEDIKPLPVPMEELLWQPPKAGKFTQLEASDECWARPLGLGRMVSTWQLIRERLDRDISKAFGIPPVLIYETNPGYDYARAWHEYREPLSI